MTRLQYFEVGGSASSGGQQGGDTVFLGPEYGESSNLGVGIRVGGSMSFTGMRAQHDTWLDELNPTTTHGSDASLQAKLTVPASNNAQRAYIAWDLTGLSRATITSASVTFTIRTDGLNDVQAPWQFRTGASQPFDESTATWGNSVPVGGTTRQSGTSLAPGTLTGGWSTHTIVLNSTARANMKGNWCWLRFVGEDTLGVNIVFVRSKEHTTAAEQPYLDLAGTL